MRKSLLTVFLLLPGVGAWAGPASITQQSVFTQNTGANDNFNAAVTDAFGTTHVLVDDTNKHVSIMRFDGITGSALAPIPLDATGNITWDLGLAMDGIGNYIVGGRGYDGTYDKMGVAMYSASGSFLWQTFTGGPGDESAMTGGTSRDNAGNIYVAGSLDGPNGQSSCCGRKTILMKVSSVGTYQWTYTFSGGPDNTPYGIAADPAGGAYVLRSETDQTSFCSTAYLDYVDASGNLGWSRILGVCTYVQGIAVAGNRVYVGVGNGGVGVQTFSTTNSGMPLGGAFYSSFSGTQFTMTSLAVDAGGTVYVGGIARPVGYNAGAVLAFGANLSGTLWLAIDNTGLYEDMNSRRKVTLDASGNVILSGGSAFYTGTCSAPGDLMVRKFQKANGSVSWSKVFDGPVTPSLTGSARDAAGNIYVATKEPPLLLKYNSAFTLQWSRSFTSTMFCDGSFGRPAERGGFVYLPIQVEPACTVNCSSGQEQVVVGKYDAVTGNSVATYVSPTLGDPNDIGGVALDAAGNIFTVVGTKTNTGSRVELTKLNSTGTFQWTTNVANVLFSIGAPLTIDGAGNAIVAYPSFSTTWGGGAIFAGLAKVDTLGAVVWTRSYTQGQSFAFPGGVATSGTTIYLASGENNLDFSGPIQPPTFSEGVLRRIDATGALQWTRTVDLGQQAGFTGVNADLGGTVYVTGLVGTTWALDDGLQMVDGDVFAQAYAADSACGAPIWTARYDSGGKDLGMDIFAGARTVVAGGDSIRLLQFTEGVADVATLALTLTATAAPAEVGQVVTVSLLVSNSGGRDALGVSATMMINSGAAGMKAYPLSSTQSFDVLSGQSRTLKWSLTATAQSTLVFSATATGTEACSGTIRTTTVGQTLLTGYRSLLSPAAVLYSRTIMGIGDTVKVTITLSNTGAAGALLNAVSGTVASVSGPSMLPVGSVNSSIATLNAGSSTAFNFTFSATGAGVVILSMSGTGTDPIFGALTINGGSVPLTVLDGARLTAAFVPGPQNTASVGQWIPISMTVSNTGSYPAIGVTATIYIGPGGAALTLQSAPGSMTLNAHSSTVFMWTYSVSGSGPVTATMTATGTDGSPLGYALQASATASGIMQTPPVLGGLAAHYPPLTVEVGQQVFVTLTLSNTGQATAYLNNQSNKVYDAGTGSVTGPSSIFPPFSYTLTGGQSITYSLTVTAATPGTHFMTGSLTGWDANSGATIFSPSFPPSNTLTIVQAPILTASLAATPLTLHPPQTILVTLSVSNSGGVTANAVQPSATLTVAGLGGVSKLAGPTPGPTTLAPGSTVVFSWTMSADAAGTVAFTNSATGVSAISGNTAWTGPATSSIVTIQNLLSSAISASTTTLKGGQVALITMTITNTGSVDADNIVPVLQLSPTMYAAAGPPSQTNFSIAVGGSTTVTWNLSGVETGTLSVTAYATGLDLTDSTLVSTSASVNVDVKSSLGSRVTIVPGSAKEGETFEIDFTVTKNGASGATNVLPSTRPVISDASLVEYVSGPTPASKTPLLSGTSVTFKWTYKALKAGTVTFTTTASATVSAQLESTQAAATLTIKKLVDIPAFEGETLVYPNPVTGDLINLAVRMKDPMSKVELDVYNTGFQRVYHGEWPALPQGDSLLEILGAKKWAPGTYLVRVTATRAAGGTQTFKNFRIAVKH